MRSQIHRLLRNFPWEAPAPRPNERGGSLLGSRLWLTVPPLPPATTSLGPALNSIITFTQLHIFIRVQYRLLLVVYFPVTLKYFVCFVVAKCDLVNNVEMAFQIADSPTSLI